MDLEAELQASKVETAGLAERVREHEAAENSRAAAEAKETIGALERSVYANEEELEAAQRRLSETVEELLVTRETVATLTGSLEASEARVADLRERLEAGRESWPHGAEALWNQRPRSGRRVWRRIAEQLEELSTKFGEMRDESALCEQEVVGAWV